MATSVTPKADAWSKKMRALDEGIKEVSATYDQIVRMRCATCGKNPQYEISDHGFSREGWLLLICACAGKKVWCKIKK